MSPDDTVTIVCDRCCSHVCDGHEICAADGDEPVAELNHCAGEPLQHSELATSRDDFSTQLKDRSVVFVEFISILIDIDYFSFRGVLVGNWGN
ncbi:MAG: hypothetical protein GKR86_00715, partial [Ilumatobacter sp.]|nr:hypothetical protein [Ilumatobacter sp.]